MGVCNSFKNKEGTTYFVVYYLDKYGIARTDFLEMGTWQKLQEKTKSMVPGTKVKAKYTLNQFRQAILTDIEKI